VLSQHTGVTHSSAGATDGFMLIVPCAGNMAYLINHSGKIAHQWQIGPGFTNWGYLLSNSNLFVNERCENRKGVALTGSGLMREYDWEGNLIWEHIDPWQHHDARRLNNGNTVYLAYTPLSVEEQGAIKGGIPGSEPDGHIFGECIREVNARGELVWEWNFSEFGDQFPLHPNANRWSRAHTNTVHPLDDNHFLISCKTLNLIFIVSKETNSVSWHYQNDAMSGQHDVQALGNGNILLFANGAYSADLHHSQVWEIDPNTNELIWSYRAKDNPQLFFSPHIGGCQRLASGNTLICEGAKGCVFEVTPQGEIVWEYVSPYTNFAGEFGHVNWLFRARHYARDSAELKTHLPALLD